MDIYEIEDLLNKSGYSVIVDENRFFIYYNDSAIGFCEDGRFYLCISDEASPGFTADELRLVAALADYSYNYCT